jgi:hypothetical protein
MWPIIRVGNIGQNINVITFLACAFLNVPIPLDCPLSYRGPIRVENFILKIVTGAREENIQLNLSTPTKIFGFQYRYCMFDHPQHP